MFNLHPIVFLVLESTFHVPYYYAMTPYFCWKHRRKKTKQCWTNLELKISWLDQGDQLLTLTLTLGRWGVPPVVESAMMLTFVYDDGFSWFVFLTPKSWGKIPPKIDEHFLFFQMGWKYTNTRCVAFFSGGAICCLTKATPISRLDLCLIFERKAIGSSWKGWWLELEGLSSFDNRMFNGKIEAW